MKLMKINTKLGVIILISTILLAACLIYYYSSFPLPSIRPISQPVSTLKNLKTFSSAEEFKSYLEKGKLAFYYEPTSFGGFEISTLRETASVPERVSETTVQVPGIDEPDILKTDGKEIYFSKEGYYIQRWFVEKIIPPKITGETKIIKAFPPEDLKIDGKIEKSGDLLLKENILIIFSGDKIFGYNVANPKLPEKKWEIELKENGILVGARLFKDKIYFVTKNQIKEPYPCPIEPLEIGEKK